MEPTVSLRAAGRTFSASRRALQKSSPYFEAMFTCGMRESAAAEIEIQDIDPELLQVLIDVSEGKNIEISDVNVYDLLRASVVFQFCEVSEKCTDYLIHSLSVQNAVSVWIAGDTFAVKRLCGAALAVMLWNFDEFAESPRCAHACTATLLMSLLSQNRLNVSGESVICELVRDWLRSNLEKCRDEEILQLLSAVRYSHVDVQVVEALRNSSTGLVSEFTDVVLALLRKQEICLDSRLAELAKHSLTLPRRTFPVVPAVVVARAAPMPGDPLANSLCVFVRSAKGAFTFHSTVPTLPKPLQGYVVCPVGNDVYFLCGEYGIGSGRWNRDVLKWDPYRRSWMRIGAIPSVRRHCKVAVVGKRIYLVGGFGRFRVVLDSVDVFDTSSGQWRCGSRIPCPVFSAAVCAAEDSIFLFSGRVYRYDISKDTWLLLVPWFPSGPFAALPGGRNITLVPESGGPLLQFDTCTITYRYLATWDRTAACACIVGDVIFCLSDEGRGTLYRLGEEDRVTDVEVGVDQSGKVDCCFAMPFFDYEGQ